jgi:DNA-binding transcriptional ArsR family regulator
MAVVRLRTRRDRRELADLETVRDVLQDLAAASSSPLVGRFVEAVERELSARSGWRFIMVEPHLHDQVVGYLTEHSKRPLKALRLWSKLFTVLPPDSNEVLLSRGELAQAVGLQPRTVSEIMGELESIGAVYRRQEGRGVRYFVHPSLGTHLTGAVRDKAQAEAPKLRIVEPAE